MNNQAGRKTGCFTKAFENVKNIPSGIFEDNPGAISNNRTSVLMLKTKL
jgi:hypothetical protein